MYINNYKSHWLVDYILSRYLFYLNANYKDEKNKGGLAQLRAFTSHPKLKRIYSSG